MEPPLKEDGTAYSAEHSSGQKIVIARFVSYGLIFVALILAYIIKEKFTPTPDHSETIAFLGPLGIILTLLGAILGKISGGRYVVFAHIILIALFVIILMTSGEFSLIYLVLLFPVFIFGPILVSAAMGIKKLTETVSQKSDGVEKDIS